MSETIIHQHYVPRVHLRLFSNSPPAEKIKKAYILDVQNNEMRFENIEKYAHERYFYDVDFCKLLEMLKAEYPLLEVPSDIMEFSKESDKQFIENHFGNEFEGKLFNYFLNIVSKYALSIPQRRSELDVFSSSDKSMMSIYLVNQYLRTRKFRDRLTSMYTKSITDECKRHLNGKVDSRILDNLSLTVDDKNTLHNLHATYMFDYDGIVRTSKTLFRKVWYAALTDFENPFYLSDNPVVIDDYQTLSGFSFGCSRIVFPISPTIALVLDDVRIQADTLSSENKFKFVNKEFVQRCNSLQRAQCLRYVFSATSLSEFLAKESV